MTRPLLIAANGFLLSAILACSAFAQSTPEQSSDRSLMPNWFGRRSDQSTTQPAPQPTTQQQRTTQGATPRVANVPRAGSAQASPAALPGLGGSPLPQSNWSPAGANAATRTAQPMETTRDYPVIQEDAPRQPASAAPSTRAGTTDTNASPAVRQSPNHRMLPHVNPEALRRELSGSFSQPKATPRIARVEQKSVPVEDAANPAITTPSAALQPIVINDDAPAARPISPQPQRNNLSGAGSQTQNADRYGAARPLGQSTISDSRKESFGEALQIASGGDPSVLAANQAPMITTDIRGPKQILVGREAVYRVRLQNQGAGAAEGIVVSVKIPSWAEVVDSAATQGTVKAAENSSASPQLDWQIAHVDGRGSETLDIRLIPRQSRPLELGVSWTLAAVASKAIVEVQEPKLQVDVAGPNEVLFEKPQVFRLTISNPGTGPTEKVQIQLVPPGGGQATTHPIGDLAAGDSKTVEVELTPREAGKLVVAVNATAEGGLTCDASKEVFCRKPELDVEWRGPSQTYAGTTGTYYFRVRNPGTAPAEDVTVKVALPQGVEFAQGSEGQSYDASTNEVTWKVGTLGPGDDNYMELKCVLNTAGNVQLRVTGATAAGDLTDSDTAQTNVVALADLKLEVSDPSGAVAVGAATTYEIRVQNRGTSAAKAVSVVGLFSEGIEPDQAEGAEYTVADGRVAFNTIEDLPAGRDITLKIRAHAVKAGTHVFRAEVLCSDAEIKLAAEETTRFYTEETQPQSPTDAAQ